MNVSIELGIRVYGPIEYYYMIKCPQCIYCWGTPHKVGVAWLVEGSLKVERKAATARMDGRPRKFAAVYPPLVTRS